MSEPVDETLSPWQRTSTRVVYENAWLSVREDAVIDPSGRPGIYGVITPRNWALGVLPFLDDGSVVLVGQYRYAHQRYSWEMPEGGGAKDVSMLESIERELREETGYAAASWHPLFADATLSNSVMDEQVFIWLAWDLTPGAAEPESTEALVVRTEPFSRVVEMVWDGTIHDAMTIMAVTRTEAMRLRGELPPALAARLR